MIGGRLMLHDWFMFSLQVHWGALSVHFIVSWSHIWRRLSGTSNPMRWLDTFLTQSLEMDSGGYFNSTSPDLIVLGLCWGVFDFNVFIYLGLLRLWMVVASRGHQHYKRLILICSLHDWETSAFSEGNKFPKISTLFSYKGNNEGIMRWFWILYQRL